MKQEQGAESEAHGKRALTSHPSGFPKHGAPAFAVLLDCFLPGVRNFRAIVDALDGRAPIETIRQWRAGRRAAPLWAMELLRSKLAQRHATAEIAFARYRPPASRGEYGLRALRRWAKEKARREAGLPSTD